MSSVGFPDIPTSLLCLLARLLQFLYTHPAVLGLIVPVSAQTFLPCLDFGSLLFLPCALWAWFLPGEGLQGE